MVKRKAKLDKNLEVFRKAYHYTRWSKENFFRWCILEREKPQSEKKVKNHSYQYIKIYIIYYRYDQKTLSKWMEDDTFNAQFTWAFNQCEDRVWGHFLTSNHNSNIALDSYYNYPEVKNCIKLNCDNYGLSRYKGVCGNCFLFCPGEDDAFQKYINTRKNATSIPFHQFHLNNSIKTDSRIFIVWSRISDLYESKKKLAAQEQKNQKLINWINDELVCLIKKNSGERFVPGPDNFVIATSLNFFQPLEAPPQYSKKNNWPKIIEQINDQLEHNQNTTITFVASRPASFSNHFRGLKKLFESCKYPERLFLVTAGLAENENRPIIFSIKSFLAYLDVAIESKLPFKDLFTYTEQSVFGKYFALFIRDIEIESRIRIEMPKIQNRSFINPNNASLPSSQEYIQ